MTETMQSQQYAASMVSSLCADALIAAAVEAAARYGTAAVSVAVVDGSGLLKAFRRADEAAVLTIDIAMTKPGPQPRPACPRTPGRTSASPSVGRTTLKPASKRS